MLVLTHATGQLEDAKKALDDKIAEINQLASVEQKLFLGEVRLGETRLAALNLVLGSDNGKLQEKHNKNTHISLTYI